MSVNYPRHAQGTSIFYEPDPPTQTTSTGEVAYTVKAPQQWLTETSGGWCHIIGPTRLPTQGWKIHVSATRTTAAHVLHIVAEECFQHCTSLKFIPSDVALWNQNMKYTDRGSAGKFITVYPSDDAQFVELLEILADRLQELPGPYILSDVQWRNSPVYFRYGGFKRIEMTSSSGDPEPAILAPDGTLIPDHRDAVFRLPDFVTPPLEIRSAIEERLNPKDGETDNLLNGLRIEGALHFSSGGGVYDVRSPSDGKRFVMKEGRPLAGLDARQASARDRVEHEFAVLQHLAKVPQVVDPVALRHAAGHGFLFEEHIEGQSLYDWVAANYPYSYLDDTHKYADRAERLLDEIESVVAQVHELHVALMDIQPRNIIVTGEGTVRLIDLETACASSEYDARPIGTPGYVPALPYTPLERDLYSLAQTAMHMYQPLTPLGSLCESVWDTELVAVEESFPSGVAMRLRRLKSAAQPHHTPQETVALQANGPLSIRDSVGVNKLLTEVRNGLQSSRSHDAGLRCPYPGDPRQFEGIGHLDFESGLAGVMHALGPGDPHADEDLEVLVSETYLADSPSTGLMRGLLGPSMMLAARGRSAEAEQAMEKELQRSWNPTDISMRTGQSGRLIALTVLSQEISSPRLENWRTTVTDEFRKTIVNPPSTIISPGRSTDSAVGLLDGWSGATLAAVNLGMITGDDSWFELARTALDYDIAQLGTGRDGSLQVRDGTRLMPYLADGSAGIAIALAQIPARWRRDGDENIMRRIARACRVRCCGSAGLFHGRLGLIATLASLPLNDLDGVPLDEVIAEQLSLLAVHLFQLNNDPAVLIAGEHSFRLSLDLATGSAGALVLLESLTNQRNDWMPGVKIPFVHRLPDGSRFTSSHTHEGR